MFHSLAVEVQNVFIDQADDFLKIRIADDDSLVSC